MELIEVLLKLILVVFLVFMNGFFVAAEFALVKIRSSRLETLLQEGNTRAKYAKKLTDHLDASLSVTQLGITLASLGLGWVGEPAVAALLVPVVQFFGFGEDFAHSIALVVGFSLITAMHIILGELAPKSMAIQKAETVTLNISIPMLIFHKIMWPAVWILNHVANWVIIRLGFEVASEGEEAHSEEEIRLLMEESHKHGYIDKTELISYTNKKLNTEQGYICVSRPRRFGKSMAANMLTAYYSRGCDSRELFQGLKIATHPDFEKHLNQYNVIHLNMQNFLSKTQTIEQMIALVTKAVGRDLLRAYPDIDYLDKFIWLCEKISVNSTTVIKNDIVERLEKQPLNFFTVYNGYCNLSRFFGYQPAGMERSGMESG